MESAIQQFLSIAPNANPEQAEQFLAAAKGDLQQALELFYESLQEDDDMEEEETPFNPPPQSASTSSSSSASKKPVRQEKKFASLSDLQNEPEHDSDDDEGQEFFAGGKASGVALQGPPSAKKPTQGTIENILKTAYENGLKKEKEETQNQTKKPKVFHGSGQRLGDGNEPEPSSSQTPTIPEAPTSSAPETQTEEPSYRLTFWEDGFSIDDGPLRDYKDPANVEFLRSMEQGVLPRELKARPNEPVKVVIEHRIKEKYIPPKKVLKPFSGQGNRLGSEEGSVSQPAISSPTPAPVSQPVQTPAPASAPVIAAPNPNEPLTSLQIRLVDGTRLVAKFNPNQTIEDVYRFVNMTRVGEAQRSYVLMTTFPNKELADKTLTLQQASLLNAVIVQRYK